MRNHPDMSVAIVAPESFEHIRKIVGRLQRQTIRHALEILIVTPSAQRLSLEPKEMAGFHGYQVIEIGTLTSAPLARAAAVRRANAPLVVFAEDHSYPEPAWAAALVDAFRQNYAAVGAIMVNGNPGTRASWASFFLNFGSWADPGAAGALSNLPQHNSAYRKKDLLAYGDELEAMIASEIVMQWDLRKKDNELYLAPGARTHHVNVSKLSSFAQEQFHGGREFAAARSRKWSSPRRLVYVMGSPVIPFVRMRRILQFWGRPFWREHLPKGMLPLLILGVTLHSLGEMLGYAFGVGSAHRKGCELEFYRYRHVLEREQFHLREVALERP